ncbi:MAG: gliding motility protein GldL, partial [Dysgonamonadaceae bacterium]|nr:gliding motility protein GldL [Dysgonamonadaceae bacterium]
MGFRKRYQNIVEKFLSGDSGKRFFQVFYSVGAAVVIIGALAKINHWPYNLGTILLTTGMITEFFVFLISAFDTPVKDYQWDRVFPVLDTNDADDRPVFGGGNGGGGSVVVGSGVESAGGVKGAGVGGATGVAASGGTGGGGAIIIGGASFGGANFGGAGSGGFGGGVATTENPKNAVEAVDAMTPGQVRQSFGIPNAV